MQLIDYLLIVAVLVFAFAGDSQFQQPDRAVVVYESADYTLPSYVGSVLQDSKLPTLVVDQHVTTGDGETPEIVSPAIDAAKKNGLPSVVLLRGDIVVDVFSVPGTEQGLKEALE
jgi:hypothetical protein